MNTKINESSLAYSGRVDISITRNGSKIRKIKTHNEGTAELTKFIANSLIGVQDYQKRPGAVRLMNNETRVINFDIIYDEGSISNASGSTTTTATLTFLVPGSIIPSGQTITRIVLMPYSGGGDLPYASVSLGESPITLSSGENLNITWNLIISTEA